MKNKLDVISSNSKLLLIVAGLLLILIGNGFHFTFLKIDIDSLVVNIGALLLVVGTLQWIFDENVRREIIQEISEAALGTDRIHKNGIRDCLDNSKKIDEENIWKATSTLHVGIHYSNRFIDDHADIIKDRISNNKETILFHVNEYSDAANYLRNSNSGRSDIKKQINNLTELIASEFGGSKLIKILKHDRILRYSFILTDQAIWVRFFTNSEGYSVVPAIKVEVGSPLFEFFSDDVQRLMEKSHEFK